MLRKLTTIIGVLILGVFMVSASCAPAEEVVEPEEFYKGNTITFMCPASAGSSLDLFIRTSAPFLEKYTGATVIVENEAAGGGTKAHNSVYASKPDGLTMCQHQLLRLMLNEIFEDPAIKYETANMIWLYGIQVVPHVFCVQPEGPYNSIADLQAAKNLKFGTVSAKGNYALATFTVCDILDLDAKVVTGMKSAQLALAIKSGEVAGGAYTCTGALTRVKKGLMKPLFIIGAKRHATFPDVPAITELVELKGEKLELVKLWDDKLTGTKAAYLPPGVPTDRVKFLRGVFDKICTDPEFRLKGEELAGYSPLDPVSGEEVVKRAKALKKDREKLRDTFLEFIKRYSA